MPQDYQEVNNYKVGAVSRGEEPWATFYNQPGDAQVPLLKNGKINVVVIGGGTNLRWGLIEGSYRTTVSVDKWR